MTCAGSRKLFSRRLDGRLAADEAVALDAHLAECARCRRELARWEEAARALRALGRARAPAGLAERAWHAAVDPERGPSLALWFVRAGRRAIVAGALAAAAVWIGVLATRTPGGQAAGAASVGAQDPIEVAVQLWAGEVGGE